MAHMTDEEVFSEVRKTLVDALSVEDDEVTEDATLTGDLGAESIDFLDIVFRLEKSFSIKIPQEYRTVIDGISRTLDLIVGDAGAQWRSKRFE